MSDATARFGLPFILSGQAQKELFHNEALTWIDFALQAAVEGPPLAVPPAAPEDGQCWIVAAGASGAWAGKDDQLAGWSEGGWRFVAPVPGMQVWRPDSGYRSQWNGSQWSDGAMAAARLEVGGQQVVGERQEGIVNPSGGTVIDVEARATIAQITAALMSHGLIG